MIITNIQGGLGNQMFQYAIGKHLAILNKTELYLHHRHWYGYDKATVRNFELDFLNVKYKRLNKYDIRAYWLKGYKSVRMLRVANRILYKGIKRVFPELQEYETRTFIEEVSKRYPEKAHHFHPDILQYRGSAYIEGYFHSEKYFKDIELEIRNDFQFINEPTDENKKLVYEMNKTNSVSVHIRRGDYLKISLMQGICTPEYYYNAIKYVSNKLESPKFYFFSDDIEWVKNNINVDNALFVSHNTGVDSYWDMYLMSQCKHNIIANSSFSWWGAWLNSNLEKIVIAPEKWFLDENENPVDIIPERWVKIGI